MRNKLLVIVFLLIVGVVGGLYAKDLFFGTNDTKKTIQDISFTNIDVETTNASVEIRPTKDSIVTVEVSNQNEKKRKYTLKADVKGDTLSVELKNKWNGLFSFGSNSYTVVILVPDKDYKTIQVESDVGKISVENLKTDNLQLETDAGTINVKNVDAKAVGVKTAVGKIDLDHVEGTIIGKTDTGMITIVTPHLDRAIDLKADVGKIMIKTEKEPTNATIEVETSIGTIDVFGANDKKTVFGKGEHLIHLETEVGKTIVTK
ncbi:DUF4097 family beta strand repeat-containing protein [Sporosarcina limicola]|uniref:DUF4097 and DUF4098 domain-containing protein YvlB n=1 Tax=Sporosarcina limicola TaxID=34101 RepID=A0A927R7K8_9BACL|nr:DUF4097 family beta strand repeat-containing protein [Sporosarcina limicola]MBE1556094.1 DUF4097 and DUF4098 domain-containing protein YvlB [Sporosarcina limicola]